MVCGAPSLCGKCGDASKCWEQGNVSPHCSSRCVGREGTGDSLAAVPPPCSPFSPAVAWEKGQAGSGDRVATGLGQGSSVSPATESVGHDLEAPQQLSSLGYCPPNRIVMESVAHIPGFPSTSCRWCPLQQEQPPLGGVS